MKFFHVHRTEEGFTFPELIITMIIASIVIAVGTVNLTGYLRQNRAKNAFSDLESALREVQFNAMRTSNDCELTIGNTSTVTVDGQGYYQITASPAACLAEVKEILRTNQSGDNILNLKTSGDGTIAFNFRGEIPVGDGQTIILYDETTGSAKCINVSSGIGLIRVGNYSGSVAGVSRDNPNIVEASCVNTENTRYDNENP